MTSERLEFGMTMDPNSLDVKKGEQTLGSLQWHKERPPHLILSAHDNPFIDLSIDDLRTIIKKHDEIHGIR